VAGARLELTGHLGRRTVVNVGWWPFSRPRPGRATRSSPMAATRIGQDVCVKPPLWGGNLPAVNGGVALTA
jgi:hypothetical protein